MATPSYLDCCAAPELDWVRTLYGSAHDQESLLRCGACLVFWFHRFHEYPDWSGGNDDLTTWYSPLTTAEGERLRDSTDPSGEDLSFLRSRPSWMDDARGVRRVDGAPDRPYR
ncbi:hypothetical protein ACIP98_19225 [Streptomyces sp. NPDC088354]|uniref:hypothetical protein n=1 Tax=unclassified Streptomyces TaxID=2593676 RepID=UPI0029B0936E|nr:hypothetical protein [Streptomyces sp. MI02-7b]MDX3072560.1 hypothetical protein [Streptomyces sp. MI02-7b]